MEQADKVASLGSDSCIVILTKGSEGTTAYLPNGKSIVTSCANG